MVIDKVDKPEPPPTYRIQATTQARDRKPQGQEERREDDEYSESSGVKGWQKYYTDAKNRRHLKLRRQDIAKISFQQVVLQRGLVIIEADIQLVNSQIFKKAHLFSTKIDTYWKLKKLNAGQEIPLSGIKEEYVEISVIHQEGSVRTESAKNIPSENMESETSGQTKGIRLWPLIEDKKINWAAAGIYTGILVCFLLMLIFFL